jgi:mRNA interferase MazF
MNAVYIKFFDFWNKSKKVINNLQPTIIFSPGDIYWCHIGVNVGSEIDGKGPGFTRPVLVLGVFKQNLLLVLPLTSGHKQGNEYFHLTAGGQDSSICLHQAKTVSKSRFGIRIEQVSETKLKEIKSVFAKFFSL